MSPFKSLLAAIVLIAVLAGVACMTPANAAQAQPQKTQRAGNPVFPGWYADPEAAIFQGQYWIYPTTSAAYDKQTSFDAFSSPDLVHWTRHPDVLDKKNVSWANKAMWAPALVEKGGKYYFFFAANDIHSLFQ